MSREEKLWELVLYLAAALFFTWLARGIWLIIKPFL
jgi:hypothetical protein